MSPCPRVWGELCRREGAAAKGPPLLLSRARSARWQRMGCHGNGICSASAPREAAGPRQHPPASASYHLFLIGFSGARWLCLHEGPRATVSARLLVTLGQEGTTHAFPGSDPHGSSERDPLTGRVNMVR